jgi:hypothetical protein
MCVILFDSYRTVEKMKIIGFVFRSLCFAILMMLAAQGLSQAVGVAKSFPTPGAIFCGLLSFFNWRIFEREFFK